MKWLLMQPPSVMDVARYLRVPIHTSRYEKRVTIDKEIARFDRNQVL